MRLGKLSNEQLQRLVLDRFASTRPEVLAKPAVGVDCAALALGGDLCVLSTDPITTAAGNLGTLAVHVCCNDAVACGAEPVGLMVTLLLPPDTDEAFIVQTADEIAAAASTAGVDVLGGHTEVTDAVTRPVISATVVARTPRDRFLTAARMRPGDDLLLTKWCGLEGTAILAEDHGQRLTGVWNEADFAQAKDLKRLLSVAPEGALAARFGAHAMHDVTEGGVFGAAWEMATASHCGVALFSERIPLLDCTRRACEALGLEPYRLLSSGALLIATQNGGNLAVLLRNVGIPAAIIGKAVESGICVDGVAMAPPEGDQLLRLFEEA